MLRKIIHIVKKWLKSHDCNKHAYNKFFEATKYQTNGGVFMETYTANPTTNRCRKCGKEW